RLMAAFFHFASTLELQIFSVTATLPFPENPIHQMLIHGFGVAALILGVTLLYSIQDPQRFVAFILIDGAGRFVYSTLMFTYFFLYALPHIIVAFAIMELIFALCYSYFGWRMKRA